MKRILPSFLLLTCHFQEFSQAFTQYTSSKHFALDALSKQKVRSESLPIFSSTAETQNEQIPTGQFQKERNKLAKVLVHTAQSFGQVGSKLPEPDQEKLLDIAKSLSAYSDSEPAQKPLSGTHEMIYSASKGGSSGAVGPFVGFVEQRFLDETNFINQVTLGPLRVELNAERKVLDDERIRVKFLTTRVSCLGIELLNKKTKGQGVWKNLFSGVVTINGETTLLRVLLTPSLFIIQQKVEQ